MKKVLAVADAVLPIESELSHDESWDCALDFAQRRRVDLVVSDHYETEYRHFARILEEGYRLLIIDDFADRCYIGNVLLNQNTFCSGVYEGKITRADRLLLGPSYALIGAGFTPSRTVPNVPNTVRRVLITFGGSDRYNLTHKVLQAICSVAAGDLTVDVLLGPYYRYEGTLRPLRANCGHNVTLHRDVESLLPFINTADLMFCAAGSTVWEGSSLGVPMVVIQSAANQDLIVKTLCERKAACFLGSQDEVDEDTIIEAFGRLTGSLLERADLSEACASLVDNLGAVRVVSALEHNLCSLPA